MTRVTTPYTVRTTAAEVLAGVDLTGKRFLVTGGGSGLGAAAGKALADVGAEVVATTRKQLDLSDLASIKAFTDAWRGPLHGIVANAGIMALPELTLAANGWEMQLATNFLGHFALITGLHGHLHNSARIVLVSSGAQMGSPVHFDDPHFEHRPYDPWAAYSQSKTADVLLAVAIGNRWAADGITANAMAPGRIHTALQRHLDTGTMRSMGAMADDGTLLHPDNFKTVEQGAATEVLLAASPLLDGVTGRYFDEDNQEAVVGQNVAAWSLDPEAADRLWDLAAQAVNGALAGPSLPDRSSPVRQ
ncbi:NAD(P)-dependent dehydrogenase (short-subunit alcohol dehydrogenase family) [Actinoplanes tereljensis]|uniref:Oxidoreductase n=1 Tax=Paractinoplanes tereljensis TaxID=571912 RepID=A0A919NV50_9ACTN|nr:SDR family NAD(P)-dependent oxidoreductase [Actinoplanes tereljensis]GIF25831.1 oxidoreductase [Actinoplanes tereljensis]